MACVLALWLAAANLAAAQWAVARGIISGKYDQTVPDSQGYASRAEYAAMIMRFMESYQ